MKKSSNISVTALHRFIPQSASRRSSALPYLAAILIWSIFWRLLRLHGLFFRTPKMPISADNKSDIGIYLCHNVFTASMFLSSSTTTDLYPCSPMLSSQVSIKSSTSFCFFTLSDVGSALMSYCS